MVESFRDKPYAARHFSAIVDYARRENPFYRRWIIDPEDVPIVDRATFLENNDEILNGFEVTSRTSGSTGVPVRIAQSKSWRRMAGEDTIRFVRLLGGPLRVVRILYLPGEIDPDSIDINTPVNEQIDFILHRQEVAGAQAVTTYPTNALMLSEAIIEGGIDMSFMRRVGLFGEAIEEFHLNAVRAAFPNAQLWYTYSSMEFGMIATMCPHEPDFHHISAHRLGVEILRKDGSPAPEGETGEVVITDYFNRQSPLIRYALGDLAVRGTCPCGRSPLPALRRIHGKVRGALLHRNGNRVVFAELSVSFREMPGIKQYQVIQEGVEQFVVKLVADRNLDSEVREAFAGHFGYQPDELRTEYVDSIPLGPNGKFYASICTA